ncbi:alanine/ornithine racemase family PLP-dependent enzyme [Balneolaceae bacterium ANBcel3]|nr:alanine/ornithine racemase family PLP-dependent enzyme [Balneolaceae bacterium ANBcel3]
MAYLKLYREKLKHNYSYLDSLFKDQGISWGVVTKLFCGHEGYIREVIDLGSREVLDSRVSNLEVIKRIDPKVKTVYIKPPPQKYIKEIVEFADVSFNTELETIRILSDEAVRQNRKHEVIIMIEMGDLREGVMRDDLIDFYGEIFNLPNIEVIGLGTNLNCLHGVMPSSDKLIQLSLYKQIIELKFNRKIPLVSGGTTVVLPLALRGDLPESVNHFRIGEALYFGVDLFTGETIEGMEASVLELFTQVIEIQEKPMVPSGEMAANPQGDVMEIDEELYGKTAFRAILDIGYLDIQPDYLTPKSPDITIVDASSDMLVVDVGQNERDLKVGDMVSFKLKYVGALGLMNSNYIDKVIE